MENDVFKILEDLKWKAVGVDPTTGQTPKNQFVSFLPIGLPIPEEDFKNPWTPTQSHLKEGLQEAIKNKANTETGTDPQNTEAISVSSMLENNLLSAEIGASMMAYLQTFMLTDTKISIDEVYKSWPQASRVNDTWYAIINGANAINSGLEINNNIQEAVKKAKELLMDGEGNNTPKYENYERYRDEYYDAVKERDRQYANVLSDPMRMSMWPIQGKIYQDDVTFAWNKWQSRGNKQEIEEAEAFLSSQGIDPAILMIARAKQKYENSLINIPNIGNLPYTFMTPSKWYSKNGTGWNNYTQNDFKSTTNTTVKTSETKVSSKVKSGFFIFGSLGGGVNHSKSSYEKEVNFEAEGLSITFSYCIANVNRPWLDSSLLNIGNWFLTGDYPEGCISTGKIEQEFSTNDSKEFVLLPSIITSIILIKDVVIRWNKASFDSETINTAVKTGGNVSFGNIFVSGSAAASHRKNEYNYENEINNNNRELRVDGVQLIGFVSSIMPLSPKKNGKDYTQSKKQEPKE